MNCSLIILPGVGAFDAGMEAIQTLRFDRALHEINPEKQKLLGICLGMQLLFAASDEGSRRGLGFFNINVKSLRGLGCTGKVPHVGFNNIHSETKNDLFAKYQGKDFYFVHSYSVPSSSLKSVHWSVNYGGLDLVALVRKKNVFGTQFHPEKSGQTGLELIRDIYLC